MSATGLAALSGRLLLARFVDRVDVRRWGAAMILIQGLSLGAMAAWPATWVLVATSLSFGFTVGMVTTLSPVIVRREFGAAAFGAIDAVAALILFSGPRASPIRPLPGER